MKIFFVRREEIRNSINVKGHGNANRPKFDCYSLMLVSNHASRTNMYKKEHINKEFKTLTFKNKEKTNISNSVF